MNFPETHVYILNFPETHVAKEEEEKDELQLFFEKHNFAKEFSQSWTVYVEKKKVSMWLTELKRRFPESRQVQGNGTQFKTCVSDKYVHTTFYDVNIPKMNIQGNQEVIKQFVFNLLPDIYSKICEIYEIQNNRELESSKLPLNARIKLSSETTYTCDVCEKTYIRKALFRKHIQTKHTSIVTHTQTLIPVQIDTINEDLTNRQNQL